jgi:hypothetical protein
MKIINLINDVLEKVLVTNEVYFFPKSIEYDDV